MFCDTTYNSLNTVLCTIYQHFLETAMKVFRYGKCMSANKAPPATLLIRTFEFLRDALMRENVQLYKGFQDPTIGTE